MNKSNKTSRLFQFSWVYGLIIWMTLPSTSNAQTVRFEAKLKQDGSIELIPMDANASPSLSNSSDLPEAGGRKEFFLVKSPEGVVKGIYGEQAAAMDHPLSPGDSVQVFAAAENVSFRPSQRTSNDVDEDMLDKVAKEAAKRLLATVKASACEFDPLPETVSPTVEVSFNLFAGTSLSIQATWITEKVCAN